jgi:hypothetical protein
MDKILPIVTDMPDTEREIVDYILTDLVQLAREKFTPQLDMYSDAEIRMGLITLWEHGLLKADFDGEYIQWKLYKPSSDNWIVLPTSRAYQERRTR